MLAEKPLWKRIGYNWKIFSSHFKRNRTYVGWGCSGREANQDLQPVISFQITEDVVHCCEMGLWQEVNQEYLLHRLALRELREPWAFTQGQLSRGRISSCTHIYFTYIFCSIYFLKASRGFTPALHTEKKLKVPLLFMRLKSEWLE